MPCLLAAIVVFGSVRIHADRVHLTVDTTDATSIHATSTSATPARATLNKYCITCHNDKLKTAGLTLANLDVERPAARAEIWEKVIRKLRTRAMPPPNVAHPDAQTYDELAGYLEASIDREAAAAPRPGKLALVHRLSRTEYQNAIRDLLAIDALPKEIDYPLLLPADNSAAASTTSPTCCSCRRRSWSAISTRREKISRLAVGDVDRRRCS